MMGERLEEKRDVQEHPRLQRLASKPAIELIFNEKGATGREGLAAKVWQAHVVHGYTLAEIARHLGVHYATAGRQLRRADPQFGKGLLESKM